MDTSFVTHNRTHKSWRHFAGNSHLRSSQGAKIKIPKAMDAAFANPESDDDRQIKEMIDAYDKEQASNLEQELFKQRKRLADAERTLQTKTTKAATESKRIATDKVEWCLGKLADLRRTELNDEDHRIFPGWYAPVLIMKQGRRVRPRPLCSGILRARRHDTSRPQTRVTHGPLSTLGDARLDHCRHRDR